MTAALLGLGTAAPAGSASQRDALEFAVRTVGADEEFARALKALYRRSGVERRGSILAGEEGAARQEFFDPARAPTDQGPGTRARLARYAMAAAPLAAKAAGAALQDAGMQAAGVTHLVTASCTGFDAPGVDAQLIDMLGLSREVQRTHVGFMGCHGAINALRVASALAAQDADARVLVCAVEVCSVHFQYGDDPEKAVANALFADGAAAAVIGRGAGLELRSFGSYLVPESTDAMTWRIGDHGFEMTLSARVPKLLCTQLEPWVGRWLARNGLSIGDVRSWCIHPGGPRILSAAGEGLGLSSDAMAASRGVLAEHGNMSSPTVLFILDRLRQERDVAPCVMLGFGPGLVMEGALLLQGRREG